MSVKQGTDLLTPVNDFYIRNGLDQEDKLICHGFVRNAFPGKNIEEPACQGYCSLTFFVGDDIIVQFRPSQYKLNLLITHAARQIYGTFCPRTTYVTTLAKSGLLVYSMNRLSGVSYRDFRASNTALANSTTARATLCKDLAGFLAIGWHRRDFISLPFGIVGSSLTCRLQLLCRNLPSRFQPTANRILKNIQHIESLPWILSHGDILPSNMIINPLTQHLVGLVDWAEAEPLPFGTCFYGLEEILGEITPIGFHYHSDATDLREVFWTELTIRIPELKSDSLMKRVRLARDLGVLLWHGIAWDDGAINRVVVDGRKDDVDEIRRLDAFLDAAGDADLTIKATTGPENPSKL
ncbi:3d533ba3-a691-4b94-8c45-bc9a493a8517-CDS [Sclerotinia trifoliorum]|uniref:3d533ba3-a691-4b94-8c45-bc9a493a8517-CDS n=1 Tax=Sclerotinia trifoliorum TaxID=28548 RepID=A0A8H2W4T1_9HELO|nr:3d533ba3-a691-4b94-8c45-bc9a493a8517-CDS [Sclerotinia trifoliorum]